MSIRLFCDLNRDWQLISRHRTTRPALARWKDLEPDLGPAASLDGLIELAHSRQPATSDAVLGGLLRLGADDDLALRVVLHAVMPGLIHHARRFIAGGAPPDEAAEALVAAAWQRIRTYPLDRRPRSIGANIVLDAQQQSGVALFRHAGIEVPDPQAAAGSPCRPDSTARLLAIVGHAVRSGVVTAADARLVIATRVHGVPIQDLAHQEGIQPHSLRRRRLRIEASLAAAAVA
jgi:hypothetical protein